MPAHLQPPLCTALLIRSFLSNIKYLLSPLISDTSRAPLSQLPDRCHFRGIWCDPNFIQQRPPLIRFTERVSLHCRQFLLFNCRTKVLRSPSPVLKTHAQRILTAGIASRRRWLNKLDWEYFVLRDPDLLLQAQPEEVAAADVAVRGTGTSQHEAFPDAVLPIAVTKIGWVAEAVRAKDVSVSFQRKVKSTCLAIT